MITMSNSEAMEKYSSIVENAFFDLHMETLVEAAGDGAAPSEKKDNIFKVAINGIKGFFNMIIDWLKKVYQKLAKYDNKYIVVTAPVEFLKASVEFDATLCAYGLKIAENKFNDSDASNLTSRINSVAEKKIRFKAGDKIYIDKLMLTVEKYTKSYEQVVKVLENKAKSTDVDTSTDRSQMFAIYRDLLFVFKGEVNKIMALGPFTKKRDEIEIAKINKATDKATKEATKAAKKKPGKEVAVTESATKVLLTGVYDTLIEAYTLIEDADAAQVVIDKADEVQKAIDDIPEEKPVEDDDYEDIFDDESSEPDMEAIEDIIGDDKDALELLTADEDSIIITADDETL